MKEHSKTAWDIASRYSSVLASETRDLAGSIDVAIGAETERLVSEGFALAASACHDGYGDEGGNWRCKYQDEIKRLQAALRDLLDAYLADVNPNDRNEAAIEHARRNIQ